MCGRAWCTDVYKRQLLAGKADHPHLLVMSATPIPRTLDRKSVV